MVTFLVMHSSHLLYLHTSSVNVYEVAYLYMRLFFDDINILGGTHWYCEEKHRTFVVACKEMGLE